MKHNTPDEFEDACEVDRLIRSLDETRLRAAGKTDLIGKPFLHSSLLPLPMVEFTEPAEAMSYRKQGLANDCSGMCGL